MFSKEEKINVVNRVLVSKKNVEIEIAGEKFSTRFIKLDPESEQVIVDSLTPKFGNNFLTQGQTCIFTQGDFKDGIVNFTEFTMVYLKPTTAGDFNAHIFSLPVRVQQKKTYSEVKTKKSDKIFLEINLKGISIQEKVTRLNIKKLFIQYTDEKFKIPEEGVNFKAGMLKLFDTNLKIRGTFFREKYYDYYAQIEEMTTAGFNELSNFINVRYREESGSLPVKSSDEPAKARPSIIVKQVETHKAKILVVDDETMVTDLISRTLKTRGYQCFAYNDARGIVEKIEKHKPDAIILDINMPFYDGLTILRRLKRNEDTANIPVIMLTGSSEKDDVLDAKEAGVTHYILKSANFDLEAVGEKIDSIIAKNARFS